jgi:hypothetical protein
MISARTYGHTGFSSSAYYHFGIANNFAKFANGGIVEAGWLEGYQASFTGSNLPKRAVNGYNQVTSGLRFTLPAIVAITSFVTPAHVMRSLLLPATAGWTLFV